MVMFNLFDMLQAQGGDVQALGRQFGLAPDQSRRAMEALLPALTIGLQRNAASDPAGFGRLFGLVGADPYPGARAPAQPDMLLGQLFGSPALSQAVLQQAAAASGIGQQALRQMLPIMAGMVVAGIVHTMLNQPPPAPPAAREPEPQPTAFAAAEFWNGWMNTLLSSASPAPGSGGPSAAGIERPARNPAGHHRQENRSPLASEPPRHAESPPADQPTTSPSPTGEPEDVPLEVFQQMFQTGVQVQEQNVKAMQDIFDSFWSAPSGEALETTGAAGEASAAESSAVVAEGGAGKARRAASKPREPRPRGK